MTGRPREPPVGSKTKRRWTRREPNNSVFSSTGSDRRLSRVSPRGAGSVGGVPRFAVRVSRKVARDARVQMSSLSQRCARVCAVETHNSFFQVSQAGVHSNKRTLDRPTSAFRCADLARFCDAGPGAFRPSSLVSGIGRGKKRRFGADILLFRNHKKDLDTVTQWGNIAFFSILPWEIDHRPKPMLHEIFRCSFFHNFGVTQTICLCRYFVKRPGGREYGGGEG